MTPKSTPGLNFGPDLHTDTDLGIRIRIFTADTDGYPQAF